MLAWMRSLISKMAEAILITGAVAGTGGLIYLFREWFLEMGRRLAEFFG